MHQVTKTFRFCYGHRLLGHAGRCRFPHGHNAVVEITVESPALDELGMVLDFHAFDPVKRWIDANWDHAFLCYERDTDLLRAMQSLPEQRLYVCEANPTAEYMAYKLDSVARELLPRNVVRVRVWESEGSSASF